MSFTLPWLPCTHLPGWGSRVVLQGQRQAWEGWWGPLHGVPVQGVVLSYPQGAHSLDQRRFFRLAPAMISVKGVLLLLSLEMV